MCGDGFLFFRLVQHNNNDMEEVKVKQCPGLLFVLMPQAGSVKYEISYMHSNQKFLTIIYIFNLCTYIEKPLCFSILFKIDFVQL